MAASRRYRPASPRLTVLIIGPSVSFRYVRFIRRIDDWNGEMASTARAARSRHRGEVHQMTAAVLRSTAPHYPLIELFRSHRTVVSACVGVMTFAALLTGPGTGVRSYAVAGAVGSAAGLATAVAGELIDVVADTLLPQ
jgi:hypothetical protein